MASSSSGTPRMYRTLLHLPAIGLSKGVLWSIWLPNTDCCASSAPYEHLSKVACELPVNVLLCAGKLHGCTSTCRHDGLPVTVLCKAHCKTLGGRSPAGSCMNPPRPSILHKAPMNFLVAQTIANLTPANSKDTHPCTPYPTSALR